MVSVEIDQRSMAELWELHQRNVEALRAITIGDGDAIDQAVARATLELSEAASGYAPYLTGTLSSAHRGQFLAGEGKVYIDPTVVNPVYGGYAAVYGPALHKRDPWFWTAITQAGPRIMGDVANELFGRLDAIYQ